MIIADRNVVQSRAALLAVGLLTCLAVHAQPQWAANGSSILYTSPQPTQMNVGVGTQNPLISLDVRTGSLPQMGIAGTTDYLSFFASDQFGPAIFWDPAKDMRFGKGGASLYDPFHFQEFMRISSLSGYVGIGMTSPQYPLDVKGTIHSGEVLVDANGADYVFENAYRLAPLKEVAAYISEHHHLPDIPSAKEVEEKGASIGVIQMKLLAKIEELTLHMIRSEERNDQLESQNRELQQRLSRLESLSPQDSTSRPTGARPRSGN